MMQKMTVWVLLMNVWVVAGVSADEGEVVTGKVDAVTVYRGQALVTRVVELDGPAGLREVVVTDLPQNVLPESIYAEAEARLEVRSVRYRVRPVQEDVREEVRAIDKDLRAVQETLEVNQGHQSLLTEHKAYLGNLEGFVAPTAITELSKGVLNAETLKSLTQFLLEQRRSLADEAVELAQQERELNERRDLLQRQRRVLTGSSSQTVREAVVFVNVHDAAGGRLRLRYLVDHASWSPSYNVRAGADRREVIVEYLASIHQMSGEDWEDIAMTLSTATPSLVARAPVLAPLRVALVRQGAGAQGLAQAASGGAYKQARRELNERLDQMQQQRGQARAGRKFARTQEEALGDDSDFMLNSLAMEIQVLDLAATGWVPRRPANAPQPEDTEGVSVTYEIASRTTLPSRDDRQLIQIASLPMAGDFYKVAIPVLTEYVYDEAAVVNETAVLLLSGPVAAYADGQFVGRGELPLVAAGQRFSVGLGIDPSLRASRELIEKKDRIQGGNREVEFTYRLAVENFGSHPVAIRLLDRQPQTGTRPSGSARQINLTLISTGSDLSDDPAYLKSDRLQGILRWEVEALGKATGPDAFSIEYTFSLEYDRQMTISGLAVEGGKG